jgi:hypothetical protein
VKALEAIQNDILSLRAKLVAIHQGFANRGSASGANAASLIYGQKVNPGPTAGNSQERRPKSASSSGRGKPDGASDITGIKEDKAKQKLGEEKLLLR